MKGMKGPNAFSLLELLVVVSVMAVLLALALPAIQAVRQAAWAVHCKGNLRQLGQAVHLYHGDFGMVPPWLSAAKIYYDGPSPIPSEIAFSFESYASVHARLLPYLERNDLYETLNIEQRGMPNYNFLASDAGVYQTALNTRVSTFVCPADSGTNAWAGAVSYRGNWGVGPMANRHYEFFDSGNGFFSNLHLNQVAGVKFSTISDGLGRTVMFAERLVGSGGALGNHDPYRDIRSSDPFPTVSADQTLTLCIAVNQANAGSYLFSGKTWISSSIGHTLYTHVMPPNSAISDCGHMHDYGMGGAISARSAHPGVVHACLGDGSVRAVNAHVALEVWRALGSRDGKEVVLDSSY